MSWLILIVSGLFEAVWATALSKSEGFSKAGPIVVFFVAVIISMGGLGIALREIPVGTGYAVWTAIGAVTTILYAVFTGAESMSLVKALLLIGIVGCVIGLNLVSEAGN